MDFKKRLKELKDEIMEAFKDVPYPGDDNIAANKRDEDLEGLAEFKGKHWRDLTVEFLVPRHTSNLIFFTVEAFRFYLPAYLIVSAEFFEESDVLFDNTILRLLLPLEGKREPWLMDDFHEKFDIMTAKQKRAIRSFLEFVRDMLPVDPLWKDHLLALERYWGDK